MKIVKRILEILKDVTFIVNDLRYLGDICSSFASRLTAESMYFTKNSNQ